MCLRQVSVLCHFCLIFMLCIRCFQQPSGDSGTRAPRAYPESSITIYIGEREHACFVYLYHHPQAHFTKLLTRALFFGACHCSYIFVPCLAFRIHFAGDLNKTISFIAGVLSTSFARTLEPELPFAIKYFLKHKSYQTECFFEAMDLYRTFDLNSNLMDGSHFEKNFKRTKVCSNSG